jgi:hypothetical protein
MTLSTAESALAPKSASTQVSLGAIEIQLEPTYPEQVSHTPNFSLGNGVFEKIDFNPRSSRQLKSVFERTNLDATRTQTP